MARDNPQRKEPDKTNRGIRLIFHIIEIALSTRCKEINITKASDYIKVATSIKILEQANPIPYSAPFPEITANTVPKTAPVK